MSIWERLPELALCFMLAAPKAFEDQSHARCDTIANDMLDVAAPSCLDDSLEMKNVIVRVVRLHGCKH
jgi:hypothetical protein